MSKKKKVIVSHSQQKPSVPALPVDFQAGCGRIWAVASAEPDLAYTEQAFPECPTCLHRVEPEGGPPFCTLRPTGTTHPFAALAGFQVEE